MARIFVGLVAVLTLVGCQPALAHAKPATAQSIALQPMHVAGLQKCDGSGDLQTVLRKEQSTDHFGYVQNATEWEQWKTQGATEAYFAAYGRTSSDCDTLSTGGAGAPSGGLMAGVVGEFEDHAIAATKKRGGGDSVMTATDTGLGPQSVIGTGSVGGTTYYFAFWQTKVVDSFFIAYDLPAFEAQGAAENVNQRMSRP